MSTKIKPKSVGPAYNPTLAAAISAVVSGITPAIAADGTELEELVVTAGRMGEADIQEFAGSVTAFSTADLQRKQLFSLQDYSRFTPSMEYFGNNAGAGKIFFRGIADAPDAFIAPSSAAIYLDEQPITQSAQVDVRLIDIERVEALAGPQGTLFGSSSQSGLLRIITNKPDPNNFAAFADVSLKASDKADSSYDVAGMLNMPLIEGKLAIRVVGFTATEGGYIENVRGQTAVSDAAVSPGIIKQSVNGAQYNDGTRDNPVTGLNEDNPGVSSALAKDWNESETTGGRIAAKWNISEAWAATLGASFQDNTSDAESTYDPTVGDLQVISFFPDSHEDEWTQIGLTFEGDLGFANFVSATAYFTRDTSYQQDTSTYDAAFGYYCSAAAELYNPYCFQPAGAGVYYNDPIGFLTNDQENTTLTQEFRLFNQGERLDWVAGVFWEERTEEWDFNTYTVNDGGYDNSQGNENWATYYGVPTTNPVENAWWFSADDTDWTTKAVYGELTWRFMEKFSATAGARWFDTEMEKTYYVELPKGRLTPAQSDQKGCLVVDAPCNPLLDSTNPDDDGFTHPTSEDDDVAIKLAVDYKPTENHMIYALYSEGFRPGGTNRNRGNALFKAFEADFVENYEAGVRTSWLDGRLIANLTYFHMVWDDYILEIVDPSTEPCGTEAAPPAPNCSQPWQKVLTNVGNATTDGVEVQIDATPVDGLDLGISATWLDATVDDDVADLGISAGTDLPFSPDLKAAAYAQYTWPMSVLGTNEWFARVQGSYTGDRLNQVQEGSSFDPQMTMESYSVWDVKLGMTADAWEFTVFVLNAGDERGEVYHDVTDFEPAFGRQRTSVIRPREYGMRLVYNWGD